MRLPRQKPAKPETALRARRGRRDEAKRLRDHLFGVLYVS